MSEWPLILAIIFMFMISLAAIMAVLWAVHITPKGIQRVMMPGADEYQKHLAKMAERDEEVIAEEEHIRHPSPFAEGIYFDNDPQTEEDKIADSELKNEIYATIASDEASMLSARRGE